METQLKPLKIKLCRPEPDSLAEKINCGTEEEEAEEEPSEHLERSEKKSTADQAGERLGLVNDRTPTPRSESPEPRKESESAREPPIQQAIPTVPDTRILVGEPTLPIEITEPKRLPASAESNQPSALTQ